MKRFYFTVLSVLVFLGQNLLSFQLFSRNTTYLKNTYSTNNIIFDQVNRNEKTNIVTYKYKKKDFDLIEKKIALMEKQSTGGGSKNRGTEVEKIITSLVGTFLIGKK